MSIQENKNLLDWITIAKGIGIIFVVMGHFIPKNITPEYYIGIKNLIYTFHMPLFFLLAGFLYNYQKYTYKELVQNKIKRLIYPFILVALFFFIVKYFASLFFVMKHPMTLEHIFIILTDPRESYMSLLWFVYTLFLIFITYPLIRRYITNNILILSLFVLVNILFAHHSIIYSSSVIGDVLEYIPFFIGGIILKENHSIQELAITGKPLTILFILILFSILYSILPEFKEVYSTKFMLGILGSFLIFNLSYRISTYSENNILRTLFLSIGLSSMTIYLFHNLFLGSVKIGFMQIFHGAVGFELMAVIAITSGVLFPMILEKKIFKKYSIFRKYLLGIK